MTATLRTLLGGAVDYAGLFPPAKLSMRDAVTRYASYHAGPHAWMLGRFVVNATHLQEFADAVGTLPASDTAPWRLSVVADDPEHGIRLINAFHHDHERAVCDVVELKASSVADIANIARIVGAMPLRAFVELPVAEDPAALIDAIGAHDLGAKIRTGGVVASAIPSSAHVARFLRHCVHSRVPFKATAGLHHPMRGDYRLTYESDSPSATMFGYLNVFLAAALLHGGAPEQDAIAMLEERDAGSVQIDDDGVRWNGRLIPSDDITALRRDTLAGFGSCSFTEPVDEIVALGFA